MSVSRPSIYRKILESEYTGGDDPSTGNDASSKETKENRDGKADDSNAGNNDAISKENSILQS